MAFSQGISGLGVAAANLDVIGNNIANSGTVGFKSAAATFQDVYAGSRVGLGASVSGVVQNFTQGVTQTSSRPNDVAILNGDGFYPPEPAKAARSCTRATASSRATRTATSSTLQGLRLTGYGVNASGGISGGTPSAIQIPTTPMTPKATTSVGAEFNLDARLATPTKTPFNAADSDTFNYSNAVGPVYDSLGNPHDVAVYFVKSPRRPTPGACTAPPTAPRSTPAPRSPR
jgi:flagellar hook protein FlgE